MSTQYIGLKLGSSSTTIYKSGNGLVLKEASLIAMPTNPKNKDVFAVGNNALKLKNRLPKNIAIYSPVINGLIQYDELAILMLKSFLKKVFPIKKIGQHIKAILCAPIGITPEEKKQFELVCFKAGIADVLVIPDVICYAIGSGINIQSEVASMIVDIGANSTNIAIISNCSIVNGINISLGGSLIDSAITKYIYENYEIKISNEQAESIKKEICSLYENYQSTIEISALNPKTNIIEQKTISSNEFYPIISYYYGKIADSINSLIANVEPQIVSDISNTGIKFYGEASSITGLEKFMLNKTSLKAVVTTSPNSNMVGAGELIKYPQLLHKIIKNL